jgi:hypothetical protein
MEKPNKTARAAPWLLCLALVIATPPARGTILKNGGDVSPSAFDPGRTVLASLTGQTITTTTFSTTYSTWVYSDPKNMFFAGCLDFVYHFTNKGADANERFTMFAFGGFQVNVGFDSGTGLPPQSVNRTPSGQVIGFNYLEKELEPGQTTSLLEIQVNTNKWGEGKVSVQDGTAAFASAFAPIVIPEPSSLGLLGGGLLLAVGFLRKFC